MQGIKEMNINIEDNINVNSKISEIYLYSFKKVKIYLVSI